MTRDRPKTPHEIDVFYWAEAPSGLAIKVGKTGDRDKGVWLPKSQITFERYQTDTQVVLERAVVTAPEWLLAERGLDDMIGIAPPYPRRPG